MLRPLCRKRSADSCAAVSVAHTGHCASPVGSHFGDTCRIGPCRCRRTAGVNRYRVAAVWRPKRSNANAKAKGCHTRPTYRPLARAAPTCLRTHKTPSRLYRSVPDRAHLGGPSWPVRPSFSGDVATKLWDGSRLRHNSRTVCNTSSLPIGIPKSTKSQSSPLSHRSASTTAVHTSKSKPV